MILQSSFYVIWRYIMSERAVQTLQQTMQRDEQMLKEVMIEQYYKYLALLLMTNNFEKCLETYEKLNIKEYQGQIAIVARIGEIEKGSDREQDYSFPILQTPINKALFEQQDSLFGKRPLTPIVRRLVISNNVYRKKLVIPFNKLMQAGRKNKQQLFIFTHLQLLFREEKEVCFGLTDDSSIVQLDKNFYNGVFKNMEQSLNFTYSDLNLNDIFPEAQSIKGSTFVIMDIRNKIHENLNNFVIMGVLKKVYWSSVTKANAKEKQVLVQVGQDVFQPRYRSAGFCKIYLRYQNLHEKDLVEHLKQGCIYLFLITEVQLTDYVNLNMKLHSWQKNLFKITTSPVRTKNVIDVYKNMQVSQMTYFTNPCIFRNHYKLKVVKYELKFFQAKVVCEKCEGSVYRSTSYEYKCQNQCGVVQGDLRTWAIVGVMDNSCYAQLDMENKQVFNYFDIREEQLSRFKQQVLKEAQQEGKPSLTLYNKKTKEDFNEDDPSQCITPDKNEYLGELVERCVVRVIDKTIIGFGKINNNDNFTAFDEETKRQALISFAKPKEFLKKAKVFVNGHLRTFEGRGRLIPYVKVVRVL